MADELIRLIWDFKKDKRLLTFDEAATKQAVVLRILQVLEWDPFDVEEICPEYSVGGGKVDYALLHNGRGKVFIEVKRISEPLEKHQEQLLNYSFQQGGKTCGVNKWN